ncbi:MAG: tetratricopeptide repeat protein, partial [Chthoniobacteraceae bacterium]
SSRDLWLRCTKSPLLLAGLLIILTLLAYIPATHGGYIWDDDVYVTDNTLLTAPDGLRRIWLSLDSPSQYFPLVYTTFRIDHALWGLNPAGYHWVNILLHIANALLVWLLLSRLKIPGTWLAATIFALHPVHVESVAWITERKNVLMLFFFLLSLLSWVKFIDDPAGPANAPARRKWLFYALALLFLALALFAKTTACTLPAALFLILWLRHKPIGIRRILQIIPFLLLGIGMGLLTVWWERYHQGTHGKLFAFGLADRILISSHAVWFYIGKLLWPVNLTFSYPLWTLHPGNPLSYGWLLAGIVLCYVIYCTREDIGRSAEVAVVFFVATLSPILGFIMLYTFLYSFVADHYQYAASIGPIALFSAGMVTLADSYKNLRNAIHAAAALIIALLAFLTWNQCHIYRDGRSIWLDTLEKNPRSLMASFNLANQLMRDGKLSESLVLYNNAIAIDPTFPDARCNRGDNYMALGRPSDAIADYEAAARLSPRSIIIQNTIANALKKAGRLDEAIPHFEQVAKLQPHSGTAEKDLADAFAARGRFAEAIPHYGELARLFPTDPRPHLFLGHNLLAIGKTADALREYREALRIAPDSIDALTKLAWALAATNDPHLRNNAEAITLAQRACDLTSRTNAPALGALAAAYAADARYMDAVSACIEAREIAAHTGQKALAADLENQLRLYKSGHALGQPSH